MAELIDIIKETAIEAVATTLPTKLFNAIVKSLEPFEIEIENYLTITNEFITLSAVAVEKNSLGEIKIGDKVLALRQEGGQNYLIIDLIPNENWTPTDNSGKDGENSKSLNLLSSCYAVAFSSANTAKSSEDIVLTVNQQNFDDEITWLSVPEISLQGQGNTKSIPVSVFEENDSVKITVNSGGFQDTVTIFKIVDGNNAKNVVLTNENHCFSLEEDNSAVCEVLAFCGSEAVECYIGLVENLPLGMSVTIEGNGTVNPSFTVAVQEGTEPVIGTLTIPVTVGETVFEKIFSYCFNVKPADGRGIDEICEEYYLSTSKEEPTGSEWVDQVPTWEVGQYIWTRSKILFSNNDIEYTQSICNSMWEESITQLDTQYYLSTSSEVITGGSWDSTAPLWVNGYYMWTRTISQNGKGEILYTSNPSCIAGAKGSDGRGISNIEREYYLSTSKEETVSGTWSSDAPSYEAYKFLWIRDCVTYTDGAVAYVGLCCDFTWETVLDSAIGELLPLIKHNETNIEKMSDEILLEVASTYTRGQEFEAYKATAIAQNSEQIEFLTTTINQQLDNLQGEVTQNQEELIEYIRFNGANISLGKSDSKFGTSLSNEELKFTENGHKIAYISNEKLNITNCEVENDFKIRNFMWTQRDNGNLCLLYVGDN